MNIVPQIKYNYRKEIFAFFLLALAIRLLIAFQDISYIDRIFLPDDTYYTLAISENIYADGIPSVDGIVSTSGFQPLITLFQIPLFAFTTDKELLVTLAVCISSIFGALSTIVIGLLLFSLANDSSARLGMGLFAIAPGIILNDLNGLETSLSGLCCLLLILQLYRMKTSSSLLNEVFLGLLCTLALLARIDSVFIVMITGLYCLRAFGLISTIRVASTAVLAISPWWIYLYLEYGSVLPESGKAVKQLIDLVITNDPYSGFLPLLSLYKLADVFSIPNMPLIISLPFRVTILIVSFYSVIIGLKNKSLAIEFKLIMLSALPLLFFYTFYLPAYWFFERYFYWVYIALIMSIACTYKQEAGKFYRAVILLLIPLSLASQYLFFSKPETVPLLAHNLYGPKGYRDISLYMLPQIPPNSNVAAMQSGALNYFSPENINVVNIDGVVNRDAYNTIKDATLDIYMKQREINYFADWPAQLEFLNNHAKNQFNENCRIELASIADGYLESRLYKLSDCYDY